MKKKKKHISPLCIIVYHFWNTSGGSLIKKTEGFGNN